MIKHTEFTTLTYKETGEKFNIKTEGRIEFLVKVIHRLKVYRMKKYIKKLKKQEGGK